jgi:DedD protein
LSTPFQNRLVGTIIVTAAIVIFLPGILDGEKKSYQSDFDNIPTTPVFTGKLSEDKFPDALRPKSDTKELSKDTPQDNELLAEFTEESSKSDNLNKESTLNETSSNTIVANQNEVEDINTTSLAATEKKAGAIKNMKISQPEPKLASNSQILPERGQVNEAWVIQLGSFQNQKNVDQLIFKLKQNGYVVFTKPIQTQKGTLTKVFVGPELIKSSISKKIPHLKLITGVQGKVALYNPLQ